MDAPSNAPSNAQPMLQAMHVRTQRTQQTYVTKTQTEKPYVLNAAHPVDKFDSLRVVVACINWNHPSPTPHAIAYVLRDGEMIADRYFATWAEAMEYAVPLARRLAGVAA